MDKNEMFTYINIIFINNNKKNYLPAFHCEIQTTNDS